MNYNYLRYFSVLAQLEHYTLAAARLGISQPSLTSAIHHLEDELGGTAARLIADYSQTNDRVRFRLTESSAEDLMDLVRQEKLDMAIVDSTNRDRSLHFRKLGQQRLYAAVSAGSPLSGCETLSPHQISTEPQIVFNNSIEKGFDQWASGSFEGPHIVCTVSTVQAALDLVAAGSGMCVLSEDCIQDREDVAFVPLQNWHQALYMCILYDKWLEPPIWTFTEELIKTIRQIEKEKLQ